MTNERLQELIDYYQASKTVLSKTYDSNPEKFNGNATEMALRLFSDTINVLTYVRENTEKISDIDETDSNSPLI